MITGQDEMESHSTTEARDSQVTRQVTRALAGDRKAYGQLVAIFHESIYRMVFFRTRSFMDAEDLTQDIFVRALKGLPALKDAELFRPWLFRIALNRIRDYHRKKRILVFWGSSEFQEIPTQDTETGQVPKPLNRIMKRLGTLAGFRVLSGYFLIF